MMERDRRLPEYPSKLMLVCITLLYITAVPAWTRDYCLHGNGHNLIPFYVFINLKSMGAWADTNPLLVWSRIKFTCNMSSGNSISRYDFEKTAGKISPSANAKNVELPDFDSYQGYMST